MGYDAAAMELELKRRIKAACRPEEPVEPGDPRHFDFDEPLRLRGLPWRTWLADEIRMADGPTAQLVTGLRGSGKTTELRQLEAVLTAEGYDVIYADIGRWLSDREPVNTTDLLLALVLTLYPKGSPDGSSGRWHEFARRTRSLLGADVDVAAKVGGPVPIEAKLAISETTFQQASRHLREREGLRDEVFELLSAAVDGEYTVLLLDGGEKRATGELFEEERRTAFQNAWFAAFIHEGRDLRPPVHVVYTVPPFMIRRTPELAAGFGSELRFLPMVRVFGSDGVPDSKGLAAMVEALSLRTPLEQFDDPAIPVWLAAHSGGYFRDLLRFINHMLHVVGDRPRFSRDDACFAVEQVRQTYTQGLGLVLEERQILKRVHPSHEFPSDEGSRARMDALLEGYKMFRYHNGRDWYDAHPLFWELLDFDAPLSWEQAAAFGEAK